MGRISAGQVRLGPCTSPCKTLLRESSLLTSSWDPPSFHSLPVITPMGTCGWPTLSSLQAGRRINLNFGFLSLSQKRGRKESVTTIA